VRVRCAELGIPSSIEMGGKDAAIVLADCAMDRTVASIVHWALSNAGQACGAIEVAYVDHTIADAFVERVARAFRSLRVGLDGDVAPMAHERQLAVVEAHVKDAIENGAKLVSGGARTGEGLGYEPTLLDRCTSRMRVVSEETFGPVLAVVRVDGAAEAIAAVNASRYGLGASLWTSDVARARRLAERLDVGVVSINSHAFTGAVPSLPWTGTRDTGFGVANSAFSLLTFARPKAYVEDASAKPELFYMPYDKDLLALGEGLADAQAGKLSRAVRIPLLLRLRMKSLTRFWKGGGPRA
jgi:acyl-CoA reductase-like NAD-dependent aldehyde dehydrogenase